MVKKDFIRVIQKDETELDGSGFDLQDSRNNIAHV